MVCPLEKQRFCYYVQQRGTTRLFHDVFTLIWRGAGRLSLYDDSCRAQCPRGGGDRQYRREPCAELGQTPLPARYVRSEHACAEEERVTRHGGARKNNELQSGKEQKTGGKVLARASDKSADAGSTHRRVP